MIKFIKEFNLKDLFYTFESAKIIHTVRGDFIFFYFSVFGLFESCVLKIR